MTETTNARLQEFQDLVQGESAGTWILPTRLARASRAKLEVGDAKYGPDTWREFDLLAHALGEVVDLYNYAYLEWLALSELGSRAKLLGQDARAQACDGASGLMVLAAAGAATWHSQLTLIQRQLDDAGVPRSVSGKDRVVDGGVEA